MAQPKPKPHSSSHSWCSTCTSESSLFGSSADSRILTSGENKAIVKIIDYHHSNIELLDFVQHILCLEKSKGEQVLSMSPALDAALLHEYSKGVRDENPSASFKEMADNLLSSLLKNLGDDKGCNIAATSKPTPDVIDWTIVGPWTLNSDLAIAKHLLEFIPYVDESEAESRETSVMHLAEVPASARVPGHCSSRKGVLDSVESVDESEEHSQKKARSSGQHPLIHSNLPAWASKALAATGRYWVTGLIVDKDQVTLCYFDRFLVASAASFSLLRSPGRLALVLYAMRQTTRTQAGFDPHLRPWPSIRRAVATPEMLAQLELPVKNLVGSYFEYPMDLGSSALTPFLVTNIIRRPVSLLHRATAVYKGHVLQSGGTLSPETYVLKLSWPLRRSVSESDIVEMLKAKLPVEAHGHLPDISCATTLDASQLSLPWLGLGLKLTDKNHWDRVLRGMVVKVYSNLWEAGSIENFKQAWLDCLEVHHLALRLGKVLHRDLSEGNLMVLHLPDGSVNGVLNDWDLAGRIDKLGGPAPNSEQCVGTPPFMAIDLLEGLWSRKPCTHILRHELESFVYILIWAAVHYDLANKKRDHGVHPVLELWTGSLRQNSNAKHAVFFPGSHILVDIYEAAKPEFKDLINEWIEPLRKLFTTAKFSYYVLPKEAQTDDETYGGQITFKKFMATINATPRTWGIPNYLDDEN